LAENLVLDVIMKFGSGWENWVLNYRNTIEDENIHVNNTK